MKRLVCCPGQLLSANKPVKWLTLSATVAVDRPYQNNLGCRMRNVAKNVEDVERHDIKQKLQELTAAAACQVPGLL